MIEEIMRCGNCKFFDVPDSECRKNPPARLPRQFAGHATADNRVRDETLIWGWPSVSVNDWCGKYKRKKKATA